jgi:hypothetical protein
MCGSVRLSSDVSEIKLFFSIPPHRPHATKLLWPTGSSKFRSNRTDTSITINEIGTNRHNCFIVK